MPHSPPHVSEVLPAIDRCQGPSLLATAHLMLPKGELHGGHYTLSRTHFTWRGFTAPVTENYLTSARAVRSVVVAGQRDSDRFHNCSDDEYEWLTLTPSGAGRVLTGTEAVLAKPPLYFDVEASSRIEEFPSIVRRALLAVQTDRVPSVVSYGPSPLWVVKGTGGFLVAAHDVVDLKAIEQPQTPLTEHAAAAMSALAKLRARGVVGEVAVAETSFLWGDLLHTEALVDGQHKSLFTTRNFSQLTEPRGPVERSLHYTSGGR